MAPHEARGRGRELRPFRSVAPAFDDIRDESREVGRGPALLVERLRMDEVDQLEPVASYCHSWSIPFVVGKPDGRAGVPLVNITALPIVTVRVAPYRQAYAYGSDSA